MLVAEIFLYLITTIAIGFTASRYVSTAQDFVLARRSLPLSLSVAAIFATWFGSETILGASARFTEEGVLGLIEDPLGAALCLILVGRFVVKPLYSMNLLTLGDFYRNAYSKKTELLASILMIPSFVGWIAAQLIALGIIFNITMKISVVEGIIVGAIVVLIYTYFGGMWAISVTDFIQSIIIIIGLTYILIVLWKMTDWQTIQSQTPAGFWNFLPEARPLSILEYIAAWITVGLGSIPSQDVFQRVMSAKDAKISQLASYLGAGLYLSVAIIPAMICLIAKQQFPDAYQHTEDAQLILPTVVMNYTNEWVQILFFGALLSAIMSTTSSAILAPASILAENIIKPNFLHNPSDKILLLWLRLSVVLMTVVAVLLACFKNNIAELVAESSAESLVSLFVPLLGGLYFKKKTSTGALFSMIAGMIAYVIAHARNTAIPPLFFGLSISFIAFIVGNALHEPKKLNL